MTGGKAFLMTPPEMVNQSQSPFNIGGNVNAVTIFAMSFLSRLCVSPIIERSLTSNASREHARSDN